MKAAKVAIFYALFMPLVLALPMFLSSLVVIPQEFNLRGAAFLILQVYGMGAVPAFGCGVYVGRCYAYNKPVKRSIRMLLSFSLGFLFFLGQLSNLYLTSLSGSMCPDSCATPSLPSLREVAVASFIGILWCLIELLFYWLIIKRVLKQPKAGTP